MLELAAHVNHDGDGVFSGSFLILHLIVLASAALVIRDMCPARVSYLKLDHANYLRPSPLSTHEMSRREDQSGGTRTGVVFSDGETMSRRMERFKN